MLGVTFVHEAVSGLAQPVACMRRCKQRCSAIVICAHECLSAWRVPLRRTWGFTRAWWRRRTTFLTPGHDDLELGSTERLLDSNDCTIEADHVFDVEEADLTMPQAAAQQPPRLKVATGTSESDEPRASNATERQRLRLLVLIALGLLSTRPTQVGHFPHKRVLCEQACREGTCMCCV